jgi:hypothetical protein
MPLRNVAARVVARYKSLPSIVVRATVATLLGTGDLASDIYTIAGVFALGHLGTAYALLTMLCLSFAVQVSLMRPCVAALPAPLSGPTHRGSLWPLVLLALQVVLAVLMTKHRGLLAVLKEVMSVLTCLKPGVEIWRLGRHGAQPDPGAPMDPTLAMMMGKVIERVFESIPGAILTAVAWLNHADARSPSTLASILVACFATAFVATTVAYNFDTDSELRHMYPAFYG